MYYQHLNRRLSLAKPTHSSCLGLVWTPTNYWSTHYQSHCSQLLNRHLHDLHLASHLHNCAPSFVGCVISGMVGHWLFKFLGSYSHLTNEVSLNGMSVFQRLVSMSLDPMTSTHFNQHQPAQPETKQLSWAKTSPYCSLSSKTRADHLSILSLPASGSFLAMGRSSNCCSLCWSSFADAMKNGSRGGPCGLCWTVGTVGAGFDCGRELVLRSTSVWLWMCLLGFGWSAVRRAGLNFQALLTASYAV